MKNIGVIVAFCVALAAILFLPPPFRRGQPLATRPVSSVIMRNRMLNLETVTSTPDIRQGLGDRSFLSPGQGMLFVFSEPLVTTFWMRHMHFPLDIVWLRDGRVVDMAERLPNPRFWFLPPATHRTKEVADTVLELNAGEAEEYGLMIGNGLSAFRFHFSSPSLQPKKSETPS